MGEMERLEQLKALEQALARVRELTQMMVPLIQEMADEGNSLARYLIDEYDKANTVMKSENIAASSFLAEVGRG